MMRLLIIIVCFAWLPGTWNLHALDHAGEELFASSEHEHECLTGGDDCREHTPPTHKHPEAPMSFGARAPFVTAALEAPPYAGVAIDTLQQPKQLCGEGILRPPRA